LLLSSALLLPLNAAPIPDHLRNQAIGNEGRKIPIDFDAKALRQGKFTYRLSVKDKTIGTAIIEIRATEDGQYNISYTSKDIQQSWSSSLDRWFNPLAAKLDMFNKNPPYSMSMLYSKDGASGTEVAKGSAKPFALTFHTQVIDQRVDWAAMMAAGFPKGGEIEFQVFDPSTSLSRLVGTRVESSPLHSVLGDLPTVRLNYTIFKRRQTESYSVFATKACPRVLLREEMPRDLVAVLIAVDD
jgi:hypothetical protein